MAEVVPNASGIISGRLPIAATNTVYHFPSISVPDDMAFAIKAGPANGGLIYVGGSGPDVLSIETSYPLLPNEPITYRVKNAQSIYFSGTVLGDFVHYTVEQRR